MPRDHSIGNRSGGVETLDCSVQCSAEAERVGSREFATSTNSSKRCMKRCWLLPGPRLTDCLVCLLPNHSFLSAADAKTNDGVNTNLWFKLRSVETYLIRSVVFKKDLRKPDVMVTPTRIFAEELQQTRAQRCVLPADHLPIVMRVV
jgi:hypothetical protein